jgi:hypothetical protein
MKKLTTLFITSAVVLCTLGGVAVTAARAEGLPTVLYLSGEGPPVELNYEKASNTVLFAVQSAVGTLLGKGVKLKTHFSGNSGTFLAEIDNVEETSGKVSCNTTGDAAGVVLLSGEVSLAAPIEGAAGTDALYSLTEAAITCNTAKIKFKGSVLGPIEPNNTEVGSGSNILETVMACSSKAGTPEERTYLNAKEENTTVKLEANFGTGFKEACLSLGTSAEGLVLLPSKMINIQQPIVVTFGAVGNVKELFFTTQRLMKEQTLTFVEGGKFKVNENCLGELMPTCRMKVEYQSAMLINPSLTEFKTTRERGGTLYNQLWRLKV